MPATLVFRLVNNDADQETTVQILSVEVQSAHQPNSLSGYVYLDVNDNGVKDPPEQPLPNVPITLSGAVSQTVLTAADGSYRFDDLPPGSYTITQTQPLAFQDGRETQGVPPLGLLANDRFYDIELRGDVHATGYNFGETGLRAELIGKNLVLASSPSPVQMVSTMMIAGERWFAVQPTVAGTLTTTIPTSVGAPVLELYTAQMLPIALGAGQHTLAAAVQQDTRYVVHVVGQSAEQFAATLSMELPTPVHRTNPVNHLDVNADGRVTPLDALILVNALNRLASAGAVTSDDYLDVDGNGLLTPIDVLTVINHLNAPRSASQPAGEGESDPKWTADPITSSIRITNSSTAQYIRNGQGEGEGATPGLSADSDHVDLTMKDLDTTGLVYDGQKLIVSGRISATVANIGLADVVDSFKVLFFEDSNSDGRYAFGIDNPLGSTIVTDGLPAGGMMSLTTELSGRVQFVGTVIWGFVDSDDLIDEAEEGNNLARPAGRVTLYPTTLSVQPGSRQ